jgi:hypothetical protein
MQIGDQVTPATILAELLSHAQAQPADTQGFCHVNCQDLYGRFYAKAERIFTSFDKYVPLTWYLWRAGDSGTDIAMRYSSASLWGGTDRFIGMRLISKDELAAGDSQAAKIGAQIQELQKDYDALLERYFLLLCTEDEKQQEKVESIVEALKADTTIVTVVPRYAWSFFAMEDAVIDAVVDRLMYPDDYVRRQAREQVSGIGRRRLVLLLSCLIHAIEENGCFTVSDDFLMHNEHVQEFEKNNSGERGSVAEDVIAMDGRFFFREADVDGFEIYQDSVSAVIALYYDGKVRYGHMGDEAVHYLCTSLEQGA